MMANIYGVGAEHAAPRKGYSDFVQHTGPVISGQSRQDVKSHFGRNLLMALNSGTEPGLARSLICPWASCWIIGMESKRRLSLGVLTKSASSYKLGMRKISHTLNHQEAFEVTTCQKEASTLAGRLSVFGTGYAWNLSKLDMRSLVAGGAILTIPKVLSAVGNAYRVCSAVIGFLRPIKKGSISNATPWNVAQPGQDFYKVQKSTLEQSQQLSTPQSNSVNIIYSVQSSVVSLGFLRCPALSFRPQASSTQAEKLALGLSGFSRSTLASISSINSCGKRIPFKLDLLLIFFVAIGFSPRWCVSTIHKNGGDKTLDVLEHSELWCSNTLSTGKAQEAHKIATPRSGGTLPRRLTTSVKHSNEVAMTDITTPLAGRNSLTLNKFTWRFLAVSRSDINAKPCRMSVEAPTEREARQVLAPHFILSLAARLPVQGVGEISTPSTIEKISMVQEVSYV